MSIVLHPQTVVTLIGPSHSGKSSFAENLSSFVKAQGRSVKVLSSDSIRRELLGFEGNDRLSSKDSYNASQVAFKKLFTDYEYYMQPPFNTDVIIVDTTGLDFNFRKEINTKARANGYGTLGILMHFTKETLLNNATSLNPNLNTNFISRQYDTFKSKVLPNLNKKDYNDLVRITEKNQDEISFSFKSNANILKISSGITAIIGDVHQQIKALLGLKEQLKDQGITLTLLNGDWIDKDDEESLKATIDYVHNQVLIKGTMRLIKGNHEEWVYRALKAENYVYVENRETAYFTSLKYLLDPANAEYRNKFVEVYETAYDYAILEHPSRDILVSHSPCPNIHLGKESVYSLRAMRNTRVEHIEGQPALLQHGYLFDQPYDSPYIHVFGHVEVGKGNHVHRNKVAIDQGCVSGGHLTAMVVNLENPSQRNKFFYQEAEKPAEEALLDFSYYIKPWTNVKSLTTQQEKRVRQLLRANPYYVAATLPPAPSYFEEGHIPHLETIEAAITHFQKLGVKEVVAQRKHMGSNAQVHLFKNLEDCYVTSRSGLKIHPKHLGTVLEDTYSKYKGTYEDVLVLSAELMPWSILGEGFVKQAGQYHTAVEAQLKLLSTSSKGCSLLQKDLQKEFKQNDTLLNQIKMYGGDPSKIYLELFDVVYCDGKELITAPQHQKLHTFDIPFELFDLSDPKSIEALKLFYAVQIQGGDIEGIVIKPNVWNPNTSIPTALKVRNPDYLHIVYGHDYQDRLERLTYSKDITGKSLLNIREQELNLYLMKAQKDKDAASIQEIYKLLTVEFEKELNLDPRL